MLASEIVRVVAAHLNDGEAAPLGVLPVAIPHFLIRFTAICVERRDIGVLREFVLRSVASGFVQAVDIAGFLGAHQAVVDAELVLLAEEFFLLRAVETGRLSLMEKGRTAISQNGLPSITIREAGCNFSGVTRRVERTAGELVPKRRLQRGTLLLPAVPARPPRIDELSVASVQFAISSSPAGLPRVLEVARLGRVVRTTSMFQPGYLLLRRGLHTVPIICVDGAADSELAQKLGAHPALQGLKSELARNEKQVHHFLIQKRPVLRGSKEVDPAVLRSALSRLVSYADANASQRRDAQQEFFQAATVLLRTSHWIDRAEFQVLLSLALIRAKKGLTVVAHSASNLLNQDMFEHLRETANRGVEVELLVSADDAHSIKQDEDSSKKLSGVSVVSVAAAASWSGFSCDDEFVVVGQTRACNSTMGRFDTFFGAIVCQDARVKQLLTDVAITSGVPVTVKRPKRY